MIRGIWDKWRSRDAAALPVSKYVDLENSFETIHRCRMHLRTIVALEAWRTKKKSHLSKQACKQASLFPRLANQLTKKLWILRLRAFLATCLLHRSDDAIVLHVLQQEFVQASRAWGSSFVFHRRRILSTYVHQVASVLERTPAVRNAAIDYLAPCISEPWAEAHMPPKCRARIISSLMPQLGHLGGDSGTYQVCHLLGALAHTNMELRAELLKLLNDYSYKVRIDAIHCVVYISETEDDCFHAMIEQSYARHIKVRTAAITNLGRMYRARNMQSHMQSKPPNPQDREALEIVESALDNPGCIIQHAAVHSVKSLGVLCTPGIVQRLKSKLYHRDQGIKYDTLRAYAFHMSYLGRNAIIPLMHVMEDITADRDNRGLAAMGMVSAGYGDRLAPSLNQYPRAAVRGLVKAGVTISDLYDNQHIAENALIGLCMMAPRNLWPFRKSLRRHLTLYVNVPDSHEHKDSFVELLERMLQWEQQVCAWAIASHMVPVLDIRLAILDAYLDTEC